MRFDAVVIGAGPGGSTSAIALARAGWRVALIEKASFPRRKVCGEFLSATSLPVIDRLGIGEDWRAAAGPEVRRLALFAGERVVDAPMPAGEGYGRALGRDILDLKLAEEAKRSGVALFQPARALSLAPDGDGQIVHIEGSDGEAELQASVVIAAHGSWEPGALASHLPKRHERTDLLGFKAHFHGATLARDLMPLLACPGGYGGIVWADGGRLSLSCCIRRDVLAELRQRDPGLSASAALHRHLLASSLGIRRAIGEAVLAGPWLAAGPIRPGIRAAYADDIFRVGNVAGESHPIIAEGISMAIQSGWLLAQALGTDTAPSRAARQRAGKRYEAAWRRQFAGRIRAAGLFAGIALHAPSAAVAGALIAAAPAILTLGARLSGKTKPIAFV
ncbi:NAD(P)/FAD-dependent oxidoreductase [Aureimonas sp. AU12]|uniref:NAD(P)/FAD-dependent oxidoreductase n=1 Tax=Aureimonas sp. AU12 TaxID=1638161 RepID=UPI000785742E|nr:NAD(P)/FAD-dependent oxidoreductase [Aureimonas sp. AU12]